ncbi:MAG: DUF4411 family protein [Candidatus Aminicenantes bacterium]|nr:DUF4411 family protein [Candidatus Aminicenantes bacterium]
MKMGIQKRLFPRYCIDASALINLTRYPGYPRDIFPAIWEKLESMVKKGELISPIEVYEEIEARDDPIYQWCKQNRKMFKDIDDCQAQQLHQIERKYDSTYWKNQMNIADASGKRKPWADPWVIALSICEDAIIVTDEKNAPNHIPYIVRAIQRQCLNLIDFFKVVGIKYEVRK